MLTIKEMLKISEEMGLEVNDETTGKHYILNDIGKKIEFTTDMLIEVNKKHYNEKFKFKLSNSCKPEILNDKYNTSDFNISYTSKPINISEAIIDAA